MQDLQCTLSWQQPSTTRLGGAFLNCNSIAQHTTAAADMASADVVARLERTYPNLTVLKYKALATLQIKLRDTESSHATFKHYADRLMRCVHVLAWLVAIAVCMCSRRACHRILAEEGLASCASESATIVTPTGDSFTGLLPAQRVCAVSIIRAGDSLLDAVIACDPSVAVGKILIQRDEATEEKTPVMFYSKLPPAVRSFDHVLLVDPMLATGGSVLMAIKVHALSVYDAWLCR